MTTTTATDAVPPPAAAIPPVAFPQALTIRWNATTEAVRTRASALLARLRAALDLPSATEVAALAARLDALDARLAALAEAEGDDDDERRRRGRGRRS
ncbi:MAG: hypothetical protein IPH80_28670 [Myxococcales bacterium]|nr:hypothetical protein [Myxococcales bacterium]MBP6844993.1 hypothetical protein [Kofleriaceae bacterium]